MKCRKIYCFSGLKIQPDLRNQTNQIPQRNDLKAGSIRRDQEQIPAPTQGIRQGTPRNIGTETDPTAPTTVRTFSRENPMKSLCRFRQTVIKLQGSLGLANIVPMLTILVSR